MTITGSKQKMIHIDRQQIRYKTQSVWNHSLEFVFSFFLIIFIFLEQLPSCIWIECNAFKIDHPMILILLSIYTHNLWNTIEQKRSR